MKCQIKNFDNEYICINCGRVYDYNIYDTTSIYDSIILKQRKVYTQLFHYTLLNYQDNVKINQYYQKYFNHIIVKKQYRNTLSYCLLFKVVNYLSLNRIKIIHQSLI